MSPVNANIFTDYIRPRLQHVIEVPLSPKRPLVRATYASCLATLAHSSSRITDLVQALRSDGSVPTIDPETEDGSPASYGNQDLFDKARMELVEYIESHAKTLLTDDDASVRRAFLSSVPSLCVFFGTPVASDVVLSHLNTYLNDRDWVMKCAFCQTVVGVAAFVGGAVLEDFILPVMVQALTDPEEFVVGQVLSSFACMAELGLFQRSKLFEMMDVIVRFLIHPNIWIREASAHFISASTQFMSIADVNCMVVPLLQPWSKVPMIDCSAVSILGTLKKPLPRNVFELAQTWAIKAQNGLFWKPVQKHKTFSFNAQEEAVLAVSSKDLRADMLKRLSKNEEDEQWLNRLRNIGMVQDDEMKLVALREYIWHMAPKRSSGEASSGPVPGGIKKLGEIGIMPQTVFFETRKRRVKAQTRPPSDRRASSSGRRSSAAGPHTITDALLDAATTTGDPPTNRKSSFATARQERTGDKVASKPPHSSPNLPGSASASPTPQSPRGRLAPSEHTAAEASADKKLVSHMLSGDTAKDDQRSDGTLTPTNSLRRTERGRGIQHKSSAIDLLHRKSTGKTTAETGTTTTNAFGKVETSDRQEGFSNKPTDAEPRTSNETRTARHEVHTTHTYDGNDPTILKYLDSLASQQHPLDVLDFGPLVTPISRSSSMKKASSPDLDRPWRPEGILVTTFAEHTETINHILPSPDHAFFLTASDDGSVKVWDTLRLERNLAHRSRQTHKHADGAKVKCIAFVQNTHTFISCGTDGSINVVKVEFRRSGDTSRYGKLRLVRDYQLPKGEYAICLDHFKADSQSTLIMATNKSRVVALDLRTMAELYVFENAIHHGTPTCFCVDHRHHWLVIGTTHGILDFWDIRWKVRVRSWGLVGGSPIHRILVHPFRGKGRWICVAGGTGQADLTIWDLEKGDCREVYGTGASRSIKDISKLYNAWDVDDEKPESMLGRFAASNESVGNETPDYGTRALALGTDNPEDGRDAKYGFFVTGGLDKMLRFWDVTRVEMSKIVSGLEADQDQPKYTTSHPTTSLSIHTENSARPGPSAPNAAAGTKAGTSSANKKAGLKPPRSTVISQQQQHLLRNHLDVITDVAVLESPVGMIVSVDRSGIIKVYQ